MLIKIRQNHSRAGILGRYTSPRKKTQTRGIDIRNVGKIDDEFSRSCVNKVLDLLPEVGPITAGKKFSAQAHNGRIVRETRRNSHGCTSLGRRSKVHTHLPVTPILFFR